MDQPTPHETPETIIHCPLPQVAKWLSLVQSAKTPQVGFDDTEGGIGRMHRAAASKRARLLAILESEIAEKLGGRASTVEPFNEI